MRLGRETHRGTEFMGCGLWVVGDGFRNAGEEPMSRDHSLTGDGACIVVGGGAQEGVG